MLSSIKQRLQVESKVKRYLYEEVTLDGLPLPARIIQEEIQDVGQMQLVTYALHAFTSDLKRVFGVDGINALNLKNLRLQCNLGTFITTHHIQKNDQTIIYLKETNLYDTYDKPLVL